MALVAEPEQTEGPVDRRDDELSHGYLETEPDRTLCGQKIDNLQRKVRSPTTCVVCLAEVERLGLVPAP